MAGPEGPAGPHVQRDGLSNPENFLEHRRALMRLSVQAPALVGIIDTIHLVEVARAIEVLESSPALSRADREGVRGWFAEYLRWMTTHSHGLEEREMKNNHGTCWVLQVAAFAHLTGNRDLLSFSRERFKTVLLPGQVAPDGTRRAGRGRPT